MTDFNLGDIPDLSGITEAPRSEPLADGWYQGTILAKREFTDSNGNDRVFESSDSPAQKAGRNIRLQIELTRRSDGRKFNVSTLVNYRAEDLSAETVSAIAQRLQEQKESGAEWGELFRPFMTLSRLAKLQKIANVRQFQRNDNRKRCRERQPRAERDHRTTRDGAPGRLDRFTRFHRLPLRLLCASVACLCCCLV